MIEKQMRYIGPVDSLKGETASTMKERETSLLLRAQFDNKELVNWAFGWRYFPAQDFEDING